MQSNTPVRLNIEQARKQAKDLLKALKSRDLAAARRFRTSVPQLGAYSDDQVFSAKLALHDAQRVIAIEHGCQSWPDLAATLFREHGGKTGREIKGVNMDTTNAIRHWNNWFPKDRESFELTSAEEQFIAASIGAERRNWVGTPDIGRMKAILSDAPDVLDRIGSVLLHRLLLNRRGCGPAIKFMLDHGIALDLDPTEYNNFFDAVYMGAMDVAQTVFESGAVDATGVSVLKPHVGWPDNTSMLFWAATSGHVDMVKLLLKYGAGIHHELPIKGWGEKGATSLQVAAAPGWREEHQPQKHEVARILIEDGAYYDVYTACALNDTTRLQELIDEDAKIVDATDDYGMTPLHWAARAGSMQCAEMLLSGGALVNPLNKARRTPLQLAAESDRADMIRMLARHAADLNTQDKKGRTPLHRATYEGCVEAAEALLEVGANPMVLNKNGKTAFQIARKDAKYFKQRA